MLEDNFEELILFRLIMQIASLASPLKRIGRILPGQARQRVQARYIRAKRFLRKRIDITTGQLDSLAGRKDRTTPPRWMIRECGLGPVDYKAYAEIQRLSTGLVVESGLLPSHHVLDIGCGAGRLAAGLSEYLVEGKYVGVDVSPLCISWCRSHFRKDRFQFHLLNVKNREYNPNGVVEASNFNFPFQDESFDFVMLFSVFTHMVRVDMTNYFREIARLLRPSGTCLATFFIWNEDAELCVSTGQSSMNFKYVTKELITTNIDVPENAVAYRLDDLTAIYSLFGLQRTKIHYGRWRTTTDYGDYQDYILVKKAADN